MYVIPNSEISIGKVTLRTVHSVQIKQGVDTLASECTITIPRAVKRKQGDGLLDYVHVGDKVVVRLGYNDTLNTEFVGYVRTIGDETPVRIEVEDGWYVHKKNKLNKAWKQVKLQEVLQYILAGYAVRCPDVDLTAGFVIRNASSYAVAKELKKQYGFHIRLDNEIKTLSCNYAYDTEDVQQHTYVFGTRKPAALEQLHARRLSPNVVKNSLEFVRKEDVKLSVTAKGRDRTGKAISVTVGNTEDDAHKRTLNFGAAINTIEALRKEAESVLARHSYDGYRGKITGFGSPTTQAGDTLQIVDVEFPEREGSYLIKSVEVNYSVQGFRRINELGCKL